MADKQNYAKFYSFFGNSFGDFNVENMPISTSPYYVNIQNFPEHRNTEISSFGKLSMKKRSRVLYIKSGEVPSLKSLCQDSLTANIENLSFVGPVSYALLKPSLQYASVIDLYRILHFNPSLAPEVDELFEKFLQKEFPNYENYLCDEYTLRELYDDLTDHKEAVEAEKLEKLIVKSRRSNVNARDIKRHKIMVDTIEVGNGKKAMSHKTRTTGTVSALEISRARRNVQKEGKANLAALMPSSPGPSTPSRRAASSVRPIRRTTTPLMAKVLRQLTRK